MQTEKIFPRRVARRDFLKMAGIATAGLALPVRAHEECCATVRIGNGYHTYELDHNWGGLPGGRQYGFGCGIVVDSKDRVYVLTRTKPGLIVFSRKGELLEIWEEEAALKYGMAANSFTETAHGLYWSKEGGKEFLYFTENKLKTGPGGCRITKTDLKGNVLLRIGNVSEENSTSIRFQFDNPTDVAIGPNGDIYVVDGYGSQLVHRFDKHGKLVKTIGGRGTENGKFNICHGIWLNTLKKKQPEIYIADRANNRVEVYSLDLEYKRTLPDFRLPCCFYQHKDWLYVPELGSRVSILDAQDKFVAQLGDGKEIKDAKEKGKHPELFVAPHAMTVDSKGDLYVLEWVPYGRVRKFRHTPQKLS